MSCLCNQGGRRARLEGCAQIGMILEGGIEAEVAGICIR